MTRSDDGDCRQKVYYAVDEDSLAGQRQALIRKYNERQGLPGPTAPRPGPPPYASPDKRSWLGRPKESPQVRYSNRRLQAMALTEQRAEYAQAVVTYLEKRGFAQAVIVAADIERLLLRYDPDSLTFAFASTLLLDSYERLRTAIADVNDAARQAILDRVP